MKFEASSLVLVSFSNQIQKKIHKNYFDPFDDWAFDENDVIILSVNENFKSEKNSLEKMLFWWDFINVSIDFLRLCQAKNFIQTYSIKETFFLLKIHWHHCIRKIFSIFLRIIFWKKNCTRNFWDFWEYLIDVKICKIEMRSEVSLNFLQVLQNLSVKLFLFNLNLKQFQEK